MVFTIDTLKSAQKRTFYFIGVTTGQSAIMNVFPEWADYLGLNTEFVGIDMQIHDRPENYVAVAEFLKHDEKSLGALVTTHKIGMYHACKKAGVFDYFDNYAAMLEEISCISKREGRYEGHAKDPITAGLAFEALVPPDYFGDGDKQIFILGAGGSSVALCFYLMQRIADNGQSPEKIIVSNRSRKRLENLSNILKSHQKVAVETFCVGEDPEKNDRIMKSLSAGAVIINATGKGKDSPGSPVTDQAPWPPGALVWEFNYRGELDFLRQARENQAERRLTIEDGWIYFIHGWTRVIAEVFHVDIPTSGPVFDDLCRIAEGIRR
jgi:shikimate 5-dehydrogenase